MRFLSVEVCTGRVFVLLFLSLRFLGVQGFLCFVGFLEILRFLHDCWCSVRVCVLVCAILLLRFFEVLLSIG